MKTYAAVYHIGIYFCQCYEEKSYMKKIMVIAIGFIR